MGGEQWGRGVVTAPKGKGVRIVGEGKLEHRGRRKGQGLGRDRGKVVWGSHTRGEKGELKAR